MEYIKINSETLSFNKVYYVEESTGNDSSLTGGELNPFKTLTKAISVSENGDAIFIKNTVRITSDTIINKDISLLGDGLSSIIMGNYQIIVNNNVKFYRVFLNSNRRISNSGTTAKSTLYNCLLRNFSGVSPYGGLADNLDSKGFEFNNCSFIGAITNRINSFNYNTIPTANLINCASSASSFSIGVGLDGRKNYQTTITSPIYSVTFDANYDSTILNSKGTGKNPDGSISNVGVYGGLFAWGEWTKNKYLITNSEGSWSYFDSKWNNIGQIPSDIESRKQFFSVNGMEEIDNSSLNFLNRDLVDKNIKINVLNL